MGPFVELSSALGADTDRGVVRVALSEAVVDGGSLMSAAEVLPQAQQPSAGL